MCAWSGGNFTRANPTWVSDAAAGIGIEAARHDTQDNDFTTGINECLNKTGQNAMTGTLSMGSNKISNLAAGTLRNDAAQVGQVQDGDFIWLGTTAGTAAAQTASATPAITAYKTGQVFRFISGFYTAAEAAVTLNVNGIGAKTCVGLGSNTPFNGFLFFQKGIVYEATYNGTNFAISNVTDIGQYSGDATSPRVRFYKSRGVDASTNTIVANGDGLGQLDFFGANGTNYTRGAFIQAIVDGTPGGSNDMPTRLIFATSPDGSGSPNERMRIQSDGRVAIGTTSAGSARLYVKSLGTTAADYAVWYENSAGSGLAYIRSDGLFNTGTAAVSPYNQTTGGAANVNVDVSGNLQRSTSSARYKTDIKPYTRGLADVIKLIPKFYKGINDGETQFAGLIAEDVHDAGLNEFVVYNNKGEPDALAYSNMVALAFKAIQELNAKVEALEARIAALEA